MHANEQPLQIRTNGCLLNGIIRGNTDSDQVVILLPAQTGTRIGPQRIFTEIAYKLAEYDICSICIDIPPVGDSYDINYKHIKGEVREVLYHKYATYLDILMTNIKNEFEFKEYTLLSISMGCMPIFDYASNNHLNRVVLLSPNHLINYNTRVNLKNFKSYFNKLWQLHTWYKVFAFKINPFKIFNNLVILKTKTRKDAYTNFEINQPNIDVLCIFGEKDHTLPDCITYWKGMILKNKIRHYFQKIIANADHSFFGWQFKRMVENEIINWLKPNHD